MLRLLAQRGSRMAQVFSVLLFMYIGRAAGALMYYVMEPVRQEADLRTFPVPLHTNCIKPPVCLVTGRARKMFPRGAAAEHHRGCVISRARI